MNLLYELLPFLGAIPVAYLLANALFSRSYDRHRPRVNVPPSDVTIVIPVHNASPDVFEACVSAVATQGSRWWVIGDAADLPYRTITERHGGSFLPLRERVGKKGALGAGLEKVTTPLVLFVDCDTVLPPGAVTRLASHFSPRVGGVGASLSVQDTGTVHARAAEFIERAREVVLRAMSARGNVLYLDGATAMYRTEVIRPFVRSSEFRDSRLFGRATALGDDWMLTDFLLREGYETVRAYETRVVTYPQPTFSGFVRQNVRWSRSNWIRLGSYVRRGAPRGVGRFYMFEVAGTYLLPVVAWVTLAARLPILTHSLSEASGSLDSLGLVFLHQFGLTSRESWLEFSRLSLTVLGAFATGAFTGAVVRDHRGPRLRFLANGTLGAVVLFLTSLYGLLTFWKRPAWGPTDAPHPADEGTTGAPGSTTSV
ncbi:MAG: glycosyltransferase [Thermoplasmata archaeon]